VKRTGTAVILDAIVFVHFVGFVFVVAIGSRITGRMGSEG
jgi:hypothetical protein